MEITAKRIRILMEMQCISQKKLADELQVSYPTFNNYLNARRWVNINLLRKLSTRLHTSSDYLLGLSDEINPYALPEDEQALLEQYRTLPPAAQRHSIQQMRQLGRLCYHLSRQPPVS